jgi:hypothetical protein
MFIVIGELLFLMIKQGDLLSELILGLGQFLNEPTVFSYFIAILFHLFPIELNCFV